MAAPTFVAAGTPVGSTGAVTVVAPGARQAGDGLLLFVETANQTVVTPAGWQELPGSPQGTGSAGGSSSTRLTTYARIADGTSADDASVGDGIDHVFAVILAFRGTPASGNIWDVTSGGTEGLDSSISVPGATTTGLDRLIVIAVAVENDGASFSSWANSSLTDVTERFDDGTSSGNDGALGIATGVKATAGAYGNTTASLSSSRIKAFMTVALRPPDVSRRAQVAWAELEVPENQVRARIAWAEFEVPNNPVRARISFATLEVPNNPARAQISWTLLEAPNRPVRAQVSWAEFEVPNNQVRGQVSWVELEVPNNLVRAQISFATLEAPFNPVRGQVSWVELEVPNNPVEARISWAELEVPNNPVRAQVAWAGLSTPSLSPIALGRRLFTGFLGAARVDIQGPADKTGAVRSLFPVPAPPLHSGDIVRIRRSVLRLHVLDLPKHLYAADVLLVRASDSGILNGAVVDIGLLHQEGLISPVSERDVDLLDNYFEVDFGADQLFLVFETFWDPIRDTSLVRPGEEAPRPTITGNYLAEADVIYAYTLT